MKNDQLRVALFTDTYDEINGVGNTFRYLTDFCQKTGRCLDVYTHSDSQDAIEEFGTVRICRYKPAIPIDIYFDMIFDLKIPRFRIFKDFKAGNYDVIHTATPGSMGLNALAVAKINKIPLMGTYHTSLPEYVRDRVDKIVQEFKLPTKRSGVRSENLMWDFMKWYYNQTQLVLAPSEDTKKQLEGKLDVPVGIFTRGIDTERFHPRYRQPSEEVTVLYVGRVSIEKNLDVLVELFKNKVHRDGVKLLIVGDGPYLKEMKAECEGLNVAFPGFLKDESLSRAYASSDIFVFPSTTDTFGNVNLEAMSSAVPVVVTDKMGPKEIVTHGQTGYVTTDPDDFAAKLNELISNTELRQQMGQNARKYALTRSWRSVFEKLFDDYERIANRNIS
ncbi:MAG: glycosyltransferase family 1 protein [Phycisphaerae bacterium]|nr:glycosyltransferase family 1 protein [Phycisphaerae bacterium]